jgi:hypothetical protein
MVSILRGVLSPGKRKGRLFVLGNPLLKEKAGKGISEVRSVF